MGRRTHIIQTPEVMSGALRTQSTFNRRPMTEEEMGIVRALKGDRYHGLSDNIAGAPNQPSIPGSNVRSHETFQQPIRSPLSIPKPSEPEKTDKTGDGPLTKAEIFTNQLSSAEKLGKNEAVLDFITVSFVRVFEEQKRETPQALLTLAANLATGNLIGLAGQTFRALRGNKVNRNIDSAFKDTLVKEGLLVGNNPPSSSGEKPIKVTDDELWMLRLKVLKKAYEANQSLKAAYRSSGDAQEDGILKLFLLTEQLTMLINSLPDSLTHAQDCAQLLYALNIFEGTMIGIPQKGISR